MTTYDGRETENCIGPKFFSSFRLLISGSSCSGKTTLLFKLLNNKNIFDTKHHCITYFYNSYQEEFKKWPNIKFHKGLPKTVEKHNGTCLQIYDDLIDQCANSPNILSLVIRDSHHQNKDVIILSQNLYWGGKYMRTISLNCNYLIVFKNPRDSSQIQYLARQIYPHQSNSVVDVYKDATKNKPFSYLFLDLRQNCPDGFRLWTDITENCPILYHDGTTLS